jgi:hypothetical protein
MAQIKFIGKTLLADTGGIFQGQSGATGRSDSQIEAQNDLAGTYHALVSIFNRKNPGDNLQEAAVSYQAYDSTGIVRQMASISAMWSNNATVATGYAVLRFNVDGVGGASDIALRLYGSAGGAVFFSASDTDPAGGKWIKIWRTGGNPSIVGAADLVLDANSGAGANQVFLNAYNAGNAVLVAGGGKVLLGGAADPGASLLAGELLLANARSLRGLNAAGTTGFPLIGMDGSNIVCVAGASTTASTGAFMRIPRFTNGQLNAGSSTMDGVLVIDTTNSRLVYYTGGLRYWIPIGTSF